MKRKGINRAGAGGYGSWRWWHGMLALAASLPLVVQGVTGAMLAYEREIRNALGEGQVEAGERMSMSDLVARLGAVLDGGQLRWLIYFEDPREPVWVRWGDGNGTERSYLADPGSGEILVESTRWHRRFEWVLDVHRRLGMGRTGQVIMGGSALLLAGLLLSGVVLQVKRSRNLWRLLGVRRNGGGLWLWLHAALGTWMTPVLLLLALTGPVWSFAGYRALIGLLTDSDPRYGALPELRVEGHGRIDLAAVLAGAEQLVPPQGAMRLLLPTAPGSPARFEWAPPEAPFENFRSRAYLDPGTGNLLKIEPLADYSRAERVIRWAYPLHIGKWGGAPTQFLHLAAALALPFFALSGAWLYWKRTRR